MYSSTKHSIYSIQYHIVFCTKFRYKALSKDIQNKLKDIIADISNRYNYTIIEMETMSDHVHIFISVKPYISPSTIVKTIKSISARSLFKEYKELRRIYRGSCPLWSKGYFVCSIGQANPETIRQYIRNQKK